MDQRDEARLHRALITQYDGLSISAGAFDAGHKGEAFRMANAIFILLGRNKSNHRPIIGRMGALEGIALPSVTVNPVSGTPLIFCRLTKVAENDWTAELLPTEVSSLHPRLGLDDWWNECVLKDQSGLALTRDTLIRSIRDQDGGAHFDSDLKDNSYRAARYGELSGFAVQDSDGNSRQMPFVVETSTRAIAGEVITALLPIARDAHQNLINMGVEF